MTGVVVENTSFWASGAPIWQMLSTVLGAVIASLVGLGRDRAAAAREDQRETARFRREFYVQIYAEASKVPEAIDKYLVARRLPRHMVPEGYEVDPVEMMIAGSQVNMLTDTLSELAARADAFGSTNVALRTRRVVELLEEVKAKYFGDRSELREGITKDGQAALRELALALRGDSGVIPKL